MTKRRIILVSVVFFSIAVFTVQTLPQARSSNRTAKPPDAERLRNMTAEERGKELEKRREQRKLYLERLQNMTEEERKRELAKRRRQRKLEFAQKKKERAKVDRSPLIDFEQRQKEAAERRKEFLMEKSLLGATEEQWKLIKAKLEKVEKVRQLHKQARSTVIMSLTSSSGIRSVPTWQWQRPWKDKALSELTEAQRLTKQLIALVERKNTTPQAFRRKMDALRKARSEESELKRQLSEARRELCDILTTRQEAALVLMNRL